MDIESIRYIADYYGFDEQKHQLEEETAELTVALNKYRRAYKKFVKRLNPLSPKNHLPLNEIKDIAGEIADVTIMLEQMKYLLRFSDNYIEEIIEQKLYRQLKRIEKEKTEKEKEEV